MIIFIYLLSILLVIGAQRSGTRKGSGYDARPYYNLGPRPGNGLGLVQDLSNAKILSNEPFIISFEFPKVFGKGGSGDSRKSRLGSKRLKSQRKRNRRLRQFRNVALPEGEILERTKRFHTLQRPFRFSEIKMKTLEPEEKNPQGKNFLVKGNDLKPRDIPAHSRLFQYHPSMPTDVLKYTLMAPLETTSTEPTIVNVANNVSPSKLNTESGGEIIADNNQRWKNIKDKWNSFIFRQKGVDDNEVDNDDEKSSVLAKKNWANCQLLKLLKAPQKNPHFYRLLPQNYPALIMNEEKQLQCNEIYDITDLAKDKKFIEEKIDELEKILSSDFGQVVGNPYLESQNEQEPRGRSRRDVTGMDNGKKSEEQNTIKDETLHGKSEGEVRSDRSTRTKHASKTSRTRKWKDREPKINTEGSKVNQIKGHRNTRPTNDAMKNVRRDARIKPHKEKHTKDRTIARDEGSKVAEKKPEVEVPAKKLSEIEWKHEREDIDVEKRREKQEIAEDNFLENVFTPNEINKIVKQKEKELNIFDKVLKAMKKYEDTNPYEDSLGPQKRESKNDTEVHTDINLHGILNGTTSKENDLEVQDAVRKLAKIFKILGVGKKKCEDCDESDEDSSNERGLQRLKKISGDKSTPKCNCTEACPFCQDCVKCFRECRKNALASKSPVWSKQTLVRSQAPMVTPKEHLNTGSENQLEVSAHRVNGGKGEDASNNRSDQSIESSSTVSDRQANAKNDRTYRNKTPSNRDLVRVYFDNPENKLLVWTKRGRRTMPWGPLTNDLQLYRDRARQILQSAADILRKIKETEEKIHSPGYYNENESELPIISHTPESEISDIINKVVNEDDTKNILGIPWRAELENSENRNMFDEEFQGTNIKPQEDKSSSQTIINETSDEREDVGTPQGNKETDSKKDTASGNKEMPSSYETDDFNDSNHETDSKQVLGNERKTSAQNNIEVEEDVNKSTQQKSEEENRSATEEPIVKLNVFPSVEDDEADSRSVEAEVESVEEYVNLKEKTDKTKNSGEESNSEKAGVIQDTESEEENNRSYVKEKKEQKEEEESEEDDILAKVESIKNENNMEKSQSVSDQESEGNDSIATEIQYRPRENTAIEADTTQDSSYEPIGQEISSRNEETEGELEGSNEDTAEKQLVAAMKKSMNKANRLTGEKSVELKEVEENSVSEDETRSTYEDSVERDSTEVSAKESIVGYTKSEETPSSETNVEQVEESSERKDDTNLRLKHDDLKISEESVADRFDEDETRNKVLEDQIRSIEEHYAAKVPTQSEDEKAAMIKALLEPSDQLADGDGLQQTEVEQKGNKHQLDMNRKPPVSIADIKEQEVQGKRLEDDSFESLVNHFERGQMDANDLEAVKKLDPAKIDFLVGEMQKKDEKGIKTNCDTRMKLCQAACGCRTTNGTASELDKYDIIKGFLHWLKEIHLNEITPISV